MKIKDFENINILESSLVHDIVGEWYNAGWVRWIEKSFQFY